MFKYENINWYKQSCATNMLTISMPWLCIKSRMEKASGFVFPNDILIVVNEDSRTIMGHYFDYDLNLLQAEKIVNTMDKDLQYFYQLSDKFYKAGRTMETVGAKLVGINGDNATFKKIYAEFLEQNYQFWENSLFVDLLDPVEEMVIAHIFGDKVNSLSKKDINLLLSPKDPSNLQKEQADMLQVYDLAKAKGSQNTEVEEKLQQHVENYYWIKNDYEKVVYLDKSYFRGVLDTWLANQFLADEARQSIAKTSELVQNKVALIESLNLGQDVKSKLELLNLFTNLRDDRKKYNNISSYYLTVAAQYVAKERGFDLKTVLWAHAEELPKLLDNKGLTQELEKRARFGCLSYSENDSLEFVTGEQVMEVYRKIEAGLQKTEIRGNIASPGKAIGTASVILSQDDFNKMQKDDVLVASMTRPEYLPIMKLASAIITDEGGITCHAAIVSRELGIPCIIGTQVATKAIKDGDRVEVNANHGTVIKL